MNQRSLNPNSITYFICLKRSESGSIARFIGYSSGFVTKKDVMVLCKVMDGSEHRGIRTVESLPPSSRSSKVHFVISKKYYVYNSDQKFFAFGQTDGQI